MKLCWQAVSGLSLSLKELAAMPLRLVLISAFQYTLHYGIKVMGAMTLRILELYLSFSPHPNISDGNFNLVHHFFRIQIFQINEKGSR